MKRNTMALAAGVILALGSSAVVTANPSFVNSSAAVMLQGQATSRWQPDRFGPIVSSDTLWSIAMYYGDQTDLSVYEMMDLFIELNPRAFINGRADRMMDGYYLQVPKVAQARRQSGQSIAEASAASAEPVAKPEATPEPAAAKPVEPAAAADDADAGSTGEGTVAFDVQELNLLRDQLAESISLIESLSS